MTSPIIEIDELDLSFGTEDVVEVIDGLSMEVVEGEFVVIIGPSGCGKTSLLKLIDGLLEPTGGTVSIKDTPVTDPREDVAMVFQGFELLPWRTVLDNIELGLEIQGVNKEDRRDRARSLIDMIGLSGFEDHHPNELSGGMKQRVGLARALAVDPDILLMDEPFGALDAQTKDKMQTELLQLWENQRNTVIFITHDIREGIFLADRVLVMGTKPSDITMEVEVDFDRPRWNRRLEIENADEYAEIERALRDQLGMAPSETDVTAAPESETS